MAVEVIVNLPVLHTICKRSRTLLFDLDMKLVFKKNPAIQVTAPKIRTINTGKYGWYEVEDCVDGGYEKILAPFSMAFWDLVDK